MSDDVDRLYDLRDATDRAQQRLTPDAPDARMEAADESGTVTVTVDPIAHDVAVVVGGAWRSQFTPDELGPAIVRVASQAASARLAAWAEQTDERPEPRTRPLPPLGETGVGRLATALENGEIGMSANAVASRVMEMLTELNRGLDETLEIVRQRSTQTASAEALGGAVTVRVDRSGMPSEITLSRAWLETAPPATIGTEISRAIAAAGAQLDDSPHNPLAGTPLEAFAGLATDPDALVRMIRS